MKLLLTFVFAICACCSSFSQTDFRIIGTNLYDFSHPHYGTYHIDGTVTVTYPQSITVRIPTGTGYKIDMRGEFATFEPAISYSPAEDAARKNVLKVAYQTAARIVTLSPAEQVRQYKIYSDPLSRYGYLVTGFLTPETIYADIQLLNYPTIKNRGDQVDCYAVPTSTPGFWDYGKPFIGDPLSFQYINRVLSDRIVRERQYTPAERAALDEANRREKAAKLLAWKQQQASNGVAYSQFDLGLLYFKADSVQSNQDLAFYWIKKSAEQQYRPAIQFLSTNNPASSSNNPVSDH